MTAPFHILIPARYGAARLPGKPLVDLGGKPMIARVLDCARRSAAASVTVATDDARIFDAATAAGGAAVMTSSAHASGSDRINEAAEQLGIGGGEIIVNLQGDEPRMPAALINQVAAELARRPDAAMATAAAPLDSPAQLADPAVVKVVADAAGWALYFSRAAIPHRRDSDDGDAAAAAAIARRHIGIYAYRRDYLRRFAARGPCELERCEGLEQLRALWHGERIACVAAAEIPAPGVDTAADVARLRGVDWAD